MGSDEASIEKYLSRPSPWFAESDRKSLQHAEVRKRFAQAIAEGARQGAEATKASLDENEVVVRPWGFNVEAIAFENIFLWQGEQDRVFPVSVARALTLALPHGTTTLYPHEGHLSLLVNHAEDFLQALSV